MNRRTAEIMQAAKIIGVEPDTLEYEQAQKILQEYVIDSADMRIRKARHDVRRKKRRDT